ncbi:glycoside hydrolase [Streptomyces lunaelactis]|uniref:Glycoside hydrolase n=1 Tax=Streptomyces lunaelactis TaxID=1535768 RepID=A0A2R4T6S1_9ACTN|nr:C40 family peptidase [Streptomyces lunaelactis]AVZ74843.1 glycoside hydrolase [Streptomyces lunaelactis]NUK86975.1 C40 family peptidase [Streptomyces lunaelactis]NUL04572.1 C40 family peptidase [Streptomyces lunaelactis]
MSALASHRKSRARTGIAGMAGLRTNTPAVGFTTAALASVTLLSTQSANAAPVEPKPSVEEVQKKVDDLYRQAGTATEKYNKAKETSAEKRREVDQLLDDAAQRTEKLNESRRTLGNYAAAQYRTGAVTPTAAMLFADSPQDYFEQTQLMDRMTDRQRGVIEDYEAQRAEAAKQRTVATKSLEALTLSQKALRTSKQTVQSKLSEARSLLSKLTAEEKARLAAIERQKEEEARRKAEAKAEEEAEARARAEAERKRLEQERAQTPSGDTGTGTGTGTGTSGDSAYATKAAKVLSFARSQLGKPYVWGAAGPSSYDCSGLTQAAWKAAGVDLPRTTWDQVKVGERIATKDLLPGDLVFFYDDISHVGIYIGDGMMIHAPKPGANVREESIYYMPIYGSVRPA